jgi:hypothetical protein
MPPESVVGVSLVIAMFANFMVGLAGALIYTRLGEPARKRAPVADVSARGAIRHDDKLAA